MVEAIYQIVRPFASMLFYRSYIKNDLADAIQRKHPDIDREGALFLAEIEIQHGNVPALDPLGAFRDPYEWAKKDPEKAKRMASQAGRNTGKLLLALITAPAWLPVASLPFLFLVSMVRDFRWWCLVGLPLDLFIIALTIAVLRDFWRWTFKSLDGVATTNVDKQFPKT